MGNHYIRRFDLSKYTLKSFDDSDEICCDKNNSDLLTYDANGTTKVVVDTTSTQTLTNKTISGGSNISVVNSGEGAGPNAITVAQSGQTFLFDRAAGKVYTLPTATAGNVGVWYQFLFTVSVTSNDYEIETFATGTDFMAGVISVGKSATAAIPFEDTGGSNSAVIFNGTTTGGLIGGTIVVECVGANAWQVNGTVFGSGTVATPFAAS